MNPRDSDFIGVSDTKLQISEGFARVARGTDVDFYLIQNMTLPGGYSTSLAFDLDDFSAGKNVGNPLVLRQGDVVEHLGAVMDYMAPSSPLWKLVVKVIRLTPRECGLLPAVRAIEILKSEAEDLTSEDIMETVAGTLADYYCRRAALC